jgi:hypothetical protein
LLEPSAELIGRVMMMMIVLPKEPAVQPVRRRVHRAQHQREDYRPNPHGGRAPNSPRVGTDALCALHRRARRVLARERFPLSLSPPTHAPFGGVRRRTDLTG